MTFPLTGSSLKNKGFLRSIDVSEQEETIADLVHHFVLPEVQKQMVRDRLKQKQTQKLKRINDTLMDELLEVLPVPKKDDIGPEDGLPPSGFKFKYQTEGELMETLWKDDEHPTFISGTVSTVHDEEDADKFRKESGSDIGPLAKTEEIIEALEELGQTAGELKEKIEPTDDITRKTDAETWEETEKKSQDMYEIEDDDVLNSHGET